MLTDEEPCNVDITVDVPLQQHVHSHCKSHTQTPSRHIVRMNKLQAFHLISLDAVYLQNELPITVTSPGQLPAPPPPVGKQQSSGRFLIAIVMGILVDNTITKANNHFIPYRDN
jgi:hypothetical protein